MRWNCEQQIQAKKEPAAVPYFCLIAFWRRQRAILFNRARVLRTTTDGKREGNHTDEGDETGEMKVLHELHSRKTDAPTHDKAPA